MVILPGRDNRGRIEALKRDGTHCIITSRNYGRFLKQCLESCVRQTLPFTNIIVVDDDSNDDTAQVTAAFAGVKYLRVRHHNYSLARNAGYAALPESGYVLFVDADNWLPDNFHEQLRAGMDASQVAVTYGRIRIVKEQCQPRFLERVGPFHHGCLEHQNIADACSLIRCPAFEQAGKWDTTRGFMSDWGLWIRLVRLGWTLRFCPGAVLNYRVHSAQMSNERRTGPPSIFVAPIRNNALVAIVTLFAGRSWALRSYARFLQSLDWRRENLFIVAVDNSNSDSFGRDLRAMLAASGVAHIVCANDARAVPAATSSEFAGNAALRFDHNRKLGDHMAALYATARQYVPAGAAYVWSVEDDIEPPQDALTHLMFGLYSRSDAGLMSGIARSRFCNRLIAWNAGRPVNTPPYDSFHEITETGFFCALFPRSAWDSLSFHAGAGVPLDNISYDHTACRDLRVSGRRIYMAGSVRCRHWQADGTCLEV